MQLNAKHKAHHTLAFSPSASPTHELKTSSVAAQAALAEGRETGVHDETDAGIPLPPGERNQPRRSWYLGIQSKKDPAHVMAEVFRALRTSLRCQWHVLTPYRLLCRWRPLCLNLVDHPAADVWLYASLQVYKIQSKVYLLDFQRIGSHSATLAWMNLCTLIINSLKPPSKADRSGGGEKQSGIAVAGGSSLSRSGTGASTSSSEVPQNSPTQTSGNLQ